MVKRKKIEQIELVDTKLLEQLRAEEAQPARPETIGIHRLIKNDLFLGLLLLTFINAMIFVYYQISKQNLISKQTATEEFMVFADRVPTILNLKTIINLHGKFYTKESPEFKAATRTLGIESDNFSDVQGGVVYQAQE